MKGTWNCPYNCTFLCSASLFRFSKGVRTCGITVDSVLDRDLGDWRCVVSRSGTSAKVVGVVNVRLEAEEDILPDFMLPENVVPE